MNDSSTRRPWRDCPACLYRGVGVYQLCPAHMRQIRRKLRPSRLDRLIARLSPALEEGERR